MLSVWPQWWQAVGGPRNKIWALVALEWPIRSRVITSSALVKCWNFFSGVSVCFKTEISAMFSYIPLGFNKLLNVGVEQWLQICSGHLPVGLYLGQGYPLLVGPLCICDVTVTVPNNTHHHWARQSWSVWIKRVSFSPSEAAYLNSKICYFFSC